MTKLKRNYVLKYKNTGRAYSRKVTSFYYAAPRDHDGNRIPAPFSEWVAMPYTATKSWGKEGALDKKSFYYCMVGSYYRRIRTFQEIKASCHADIDAYECGIASIKSRAKRCGKRLCSWNLDRRASRNGTKSWKHGYKAKRQWMVARV